jgi:ATP-dependent exoDNAse (exonuclease V) beta subunit
LRWSGVLHGALRTVQVDRIFRAGAEPFAAGDNVWWIVDYKTAHADSENTEAAIKALRAGFAPQLGVYAEALRSLKGAEIEIRAALYYPRMKALDWWTA